MMQLTTTQAQALLALVAGMSVRQLRDADALSAVAVLDDICSSAMVGLYLFVAKDNTEKVKGIKTLREQTGCGLKEAKDLYEELEATAVRDMGARYMELGPFKHVPREVGVELQERTRNHYDRAPIIWKKG